MKAGYRSGLRALGLLIGVCWGLGLLSEGAAAAEAVAPSSGQTVASALLPAEIFFRRDDIAQAELAPSGRAVAVTVLAADQRYALAVIDLDRPEGSKMLAHFSGLDVTNIHWVNDDRLVFGLYDGQRGSGDQELNSQGLFSVKRDGSELRLLVQLRYTGISNTMPRPGDRSLGYAHSLLQVPQTGGDEVIVGEWRFDKEGDLLAILPKRLNVVTGRAISLALGAPPNTKRWLFDAQGNPRVAVADFQGRTRVHWRTAPQGEESPPWQQIAEHDSLQAPWQPRWIDAAGQLYVLAPQGKAGESVLKRFDFAKGQPEANALVVTPGFDFIGDVLKDSSDDRVLGFRIITDAESTVWTDPAMKALQADIDRRLPGRINQLHCRRCGAPDGAVLVYSYADNHPGQYWMMRGPAGAPTMWQVVGERLRGVGSRGMATVDFYRYKARDGREIPLWVTLPAGAKPGDRRPAVVLAHGGPHLRGGYWAWDPWAQFLASRGYVVLSPEFRGSSGYGAVHLKAGYKQWGQGMLDDLADSVGWAAKQGLVDPAKVCIAGASYGGYATLMGLIREPQAYRCGAAWVAVAEPRLLFKSSWASDSTQDVRGYFLPTVLGDPERDADMLRSISPVEQAARLKAPLLLAYGAQDRRVPLEHGTLMRDALKAVGREPEFVIYPGEGHSWLLTASRLDFAQRLEAFLARNLR